jgi:hypothetical protein
VTGRYVTLLPPPGEPAAPLSEADAEAAAATGCEIVHVATASRNHHAWSAVPWTVGAAWPLPWRPKPFHPNAAGMRAVAGLVAAQAT